ncbi:phosphatidylserine/phosphatidylglycerophosphate/cardiolipin synthase family protein [Myxococcota bacterium]|nr:phosphatidylserine/phosphatidylglycerophosphate/cardiolipin synthase family protein [Myxococcota bacterium]MCZ7618346.1 phosphatidylserine/phosphatidylglycerophosphate/cardiolipin synthase family protein [Myxococcota bacterium]
MRDAAHVPFVESGSYPLRKGNTVRPLVDGEPAFRRICEAVEAARRSIWVTVAFVDPGFEMPDGRGSFFDVLDRAHARGLDVRVLFWRHRLLARFRPESHFAGTEADLRLLRERNTRWHARWDQAHENDCQHQKSWIVDAGEAGEAAFVGGINLARKSMVPPGHPATPAGSTHDVYVEVRGPAATDVHHNFVQRWNEASDRAEPDGCWPDARVQTPLTFPCVASPPVGEVPVQIQRTVRRERYRDNSPAPGGVPFDIAGGEFSVANQYRRAIEAARRTLYVEDQAIASAEIVERLHEALSRGVDVVFLAPAEPHPDMAAARLKGASQDFIDSLAALAHHEHFLLAGLVANVPGGGHQAIYVHAKIALVDDGWATIGSANVADRSFYGDTELNASFWHEPTVRALRVELLREHLGHDTSALDDRAALQLFRERARANAARWARGEPLDGLAVALDPARYAS